MDSWKTKAICLLGAAGLALLASCDSGPSAVETRDRTAEAPAYEDRAETRDYADRGDRSDRAEAREDRAANDDTPQVDGKPVWSSNRKYSAAQNAAYHYKRNGRDFGAHSEDAYVRKAHEFIESPPRGTLRLTRRNGDRLLYDAKSNTFAVATKAGAPRTMFKPEDGMAYWEKQVEREKNGGRRSGSNRTRQADRAETRDDRG